MNQTAIDILESYIKGKDDDEFRILETIYAENAELEFEIKSDDISFPTTSIGNHEIARILSRDFNEKYDKVKTYYLSKPASDQYTIHQQTWLVVMRDKADRATRVGTGNYNWNLIATETGLQIQKHKITIDSMLQLRDENSKELERIQSNLGYPWAEPKTVIESLLNNPDLKVVVDYINR